MLKDRKRLIERFARDYRLRKRIVPQYADFLRSLFKPGDWFVTITYRDRHQDSESTILTSRRKDRTASAQSRALHKSESPYTNCPPDPRLATWEPDRKGFPKGGPPVRDAALRELEHWLLELGWEAAGHTRQEIFNCLADGLGGRSRKALARKLSRRCLCCALLKDPVTYSFYCQFHSVATRAIGWVIAEEFGRLGGRWHVHLLIRGVQHIRRKRWWKRAFVRFGRNRIEPIHA